MLKYDAISLEKFCPKYIAISGTFCRSLAFRTLSEGKPLRAPQAKREVSSHCSSLHLGTGCSGLGEVAINSGTVSVTFVAKKMACAKPLQFTVNQK